MLYPYNETVLSNKKNKPLIHENTWMTLKIIILNKRNQAPLPSPHQKEDTDAPQLVMELHPNKPTMKVKIS